MKDHIKQKLEKHGYLTSERGNELIVKLDFSQSVIMDFSQVDKYVLSDRLNGWNFLTGLVEMSLKKAMIYNSIGLLIGALLFAYLEKTASQINFVLFFMLASIWIILWTVYYLVRLEFFKKQVTDWIDNKN